MSLHSKESVHPALESPWVRPLAASFATLFVLLGITFFLWQKLSLSLVGETVSMNRATGLDVSLTRFILPAGALVSFISALSMYFALATRARAMLLAEHLAHPLASARDQLHELYKASPIAYVLVDHAGHLRDPNRAFIRLVGVTERELAGRLFIDFIPEDSRDDVRQILAKFRSGVPIVDEEIPVKRRDEVRWTLFSLFTVNLRGQPHEGIVALVDVTDRRALENAKTEFVSLASHQLRTPLATIQWSIDMLTDEKVGALNDQQKKYAGKVYETNRQMIELVDILLNASRLESGSLAFRPEEVNVLTLAQEIVDDLARQVKEKALDVETSFGDTPPQFKTDPNLLRLIIENLVSNAMKYTGDGGRVSVSLSRAGDGIRIEVSDTGCGIPPEARERLFSKLFRAENAQKIDPKGLGLGLYMVHGAVELMGGSIVFESEVGRGTTFTVNLPSA